MFFDSIRHMNTNHRSFELKKKPTDELLRQFQDNAIFYTFKNNKPIVHTFTHEAAAHLATLYKM